MYNSIDCLEHGLEWTTEDLTVETVQGRETFIVYKRCPLKIVQHLISIRRFAAHMRYAPEKHWTITIDGRRIRVFSETWTGNWWWRMQVSNVS
jgi:hypothetical protein